MSDKHKHLDYIQAAIARMATNSFLFKGWAVTLLAGLAAVGFSQESAWVLAFSLVTTVVFWGLDAYYLWLERRFISLYEQVAALPDDDIDFAMRPAMEHRSKGWLWTCWRPHLWLFYLTLIGAGVGGIFIVR